MGIFWKSVVHRRNYVSFVIRRVYTTRVARVSILFFSALFLFACAPTTPEFYSDRKFPTARYAFFQSPLGGRNAVGYSMKIDKLGRVIVAGMAEDHEGQSRLAVWRFTDVGRLDPDFGDRGFAKTNLHAWGWAVDLAPNGTIVAAGFKGGNWQTSSRAVFTRLDHHGKILETEEFKSPYGGNHAAAFAILVKKDGSVVLGGAGSDKTGNVYPVLWRMSHAKALPVPEGTQEGRVNALMEIDGEVVAAGHLDWKKLAVWRGDALPAMSDAGMGRSLLKTQDGFVVGGFRYVRREDDTVREEQAVLSRFPAKTMTVLPKEEGVLNQESFAIARTGKVIRLAGYIGTKDGVSAALWGVKGSEIRLRRLPGSTGKEDRAYGLAAYENGRLMATGFAKDEAGNRRLAVWSVP